MNKDILLSMKGICKTFTGVNVLKNIEISVGKGECYGLVGENGSGKSTLMKILTGVYTRDNGGEIVFQGQKIEPTDYVDISSIGISIVHQEISIMENMSVAENIFLNRQPQKGIFINWSQLFYQAKNVLKKIGIEDIDVSRKSGTLSTGLQQLISIARAVSLDSKLIIMDEPTSSLDNNEVELLINTVKKLKSQGVSIIYISHKLEELFRICDRISVIRDGVNVNVFNTENINKYDLISAMIGKDTGDLFKNNKLNKSSRKENILKLENISGKPNINNCSLNINKGEVLGLAGLLGSGRTELANIIFGLAPKKNGEIFFKGENIKLKNTHEAIKLGIGFLTEDRKIDGILPGMSVKENIIISCKSAISRKGFIDLKQEEILVNKCIEMLNIKCSNMNDDISTLSGGNQQKVLLARILLTEPEFIILDSPTRGIDIKSKHEIEKIIKDLKEKEVSFLLISSEVLELTRNCDRVKVMAYGTTLNELEGNDMTEKNIMKSIARSYS